MAQIHTYEIEVGASAIDGNGHANNVEFIRWMQEAAVSHADASGCTAATRNAGATWVVRSHRIEYSRPAFAGERIWVQTWVADFRRAFSQRKYEFIRQGDNVTLASGETEWVFVDAATGKPKSIPKVIADMFEVSSEPNHHRANQ